LIGRLGSMIKRTNLPISNAGQVKHPDSAVGEAPPHGKIKRVILFF